MKTDNSINHDIYEAHVIANTIFRESTNMFDAERLVRSYSNMSTEYVWWRQVKRFVEDNWWERLVP